MQLLTTPRVQRVLVHESVRRRVLTPDASARRRAAVRALKLRYQRGQLRVDADALARSLAAMFAAGLG